MRKHIITGLISCLVLLATSCEKYVEGINVDPNNFTDAPGELIIGQAQLSWLLLAEGESARLSGIFTDQFTGFSNQYINFNAYDVTASDFNGVWSNGYSVGLAQTRIVQEKAIESGNNILLGVSQIVEGALVAEMAALFGDVPYSQSIRPTEFPNPVYDDQRAVLDAAQLLFTEGIANVGTARVRDFFGPPIFVSNNATWAEIGHSLKARYYLLTKEYSNARTEAKLGIQAVDRSLLAFHSDTDGQRNLFYQFGIEQRGGYLTATRSYLRKLINLSDITADRILFTPGEQERFAVYFQGNELNYNEGGYFAKEASYPIIDWVENQLILAECEVRLGNNTGAQEAFNKVREQHARTYQSSFPTVNIGGTTLLRVILEEKYISLIGSLQVFHDMRRTQNILNIPIKNTTASKLPQRFIYPQDELNTNQNFPGLVNIFQETKINQ